MNLAPINSNNKTRQTEDHLKYIDPNSLNVILIKKLFLDIGKKFRTQNKKILISNPHLIPGLQDHSTALEVLQGYEQLNNHLMITELQRLDWLNMDIEQANRNMQLVEGLWNKYITRIDSLVYNYAVPDSNLCSNYIDKLIKIYLKHLQLGIRDEETVLNFALRFLFLGITILPFEENNEELFYLFANYYVYVKLGYCVNFDFYPELLSKGLTERAVKYIDKFCTNTNISEKDKESIYLDYNLECIDYFTKIVQSNLSSSFSRIQ